MRSQSNQVNRKVSFQWQMERRSVGSLDRLATSAGRPRLGGDRPFVRYSGGPQNFAAAAQREFQSLVATAARIRPRLLRVVALSSIRSTFQRRLRALFAAWSRLRIR